MNVKGLLAKNFILAGLAHARDHVFLLGSLILEGLRNTVAGGAVTDGDRLGTTLASEEGEEGLDFVVFLGSFHECIIPKGKGFVKGKGKFFFSVQWGFAFRR